MTSSPAGARRRAIEVTEDPEPRGRRAWADDEPTAVPELPSGSAEPAPRRALPYAEPYGEPDVEPPSPPTESSRTPSLGVTPPYLPGRTGPRRATATPRFTPRRPATRAVGPAPARRQAPAVSAPDRRHAPAGSAATRRPTAPISPARAIGAPARVARRDRSPLPWLAVAGLLLVALVAGFLNTSGRSAATASSAATGTTPATGQPATATPTALALAPGPGRPAELRTWLESKGFTCLTEPTSGIEGHLCLLSGEQQTTAYVGGSPSGLGRVTMTTPYDPSPLSQEVQDRLLTATLSSADDVAAAKAALATGSLERPAALTLGALAVRGSTGRQLTINAEGWPGLAPPRFAVDEQTLPRAVAATGYSCAKQSAVIECTRSIGELQLTLSAFTGPDELRYVRLRVAGTDRAVVQQALVSEATTILPALTDAELAEAFRSQAADASPFRFSGPWLLDYYPAATSGSTVRATLYVGRTCWTGTALTC